MTFYSSVPGQSGFLPSAVEEGHPHGAAPGQGWRMEPEGGAAPAVAPPLVAVVAVTGRRTELLPVQRVR